MQKLHLVGTTTDQNGLILSARRGARSGGYTLVLDDALANAVEELRERQEAEATAAGAGTGNRVESRLPIGEIQARLRRGRSVKDVAKEAGVEPEWVERFAAPVFAEQAEVIARVQGTFYKRQRLGESGMRIGDAVRRNLVERGVVMSPAEIADAWRTFQRPDGRWIVTFAFEYRGAKKLKFEVRPSGEIVAADQLTAQLAYIAPPKRSNPRPKPAPVQAADNAGKRAVVSSGFRPPDKPSKAQSRPGKEREKAEAAMSKAAIKRAAEGERAAARKARERVQLQARREREARLEAARRERELAAQRREAAAAARLAAAEEAERRRAEQAVAAARQAEREAARRAARLKVRSGAKVVAAKRAAASKASKRSAAAATSAPGKAASTTSASTRAATRAAATKASATKATTAKAPTRLPRPSPGARVDAPPPRAAAGTRASTEAVRPRPRPAEPSASPPAAAAPRHAAKAPAPASATRPPAATSSRRPQPRPAARPGAARRDEVYEPAVARPKFRTGLAIPADGPDRSSATAPTVRPARTEAAAPANGAAPQRPPGARRTRPLRAT